jgi:short-subunit dehydrogenase
MAALMPSPLVVSYSVTKHAVLGLSRSLRVEGAAYGVRVSVLCPGVIRTPIMNDGGRFGRITRPLPPQVQADLIERFRPMDPDRFASKALQKIAANKEIIILPGWWKAIWLLNRLSPLLGSRLAARHLRIYKNISKSMRL